MPRIIQPTLIRTFGVLTASASGATAQMDFDFGNLEGALLMATEWGGSWGDDTSTVFEFGHHFQGTAAAPAASLDLAINEEVFAYRCINQLDISAVGNFVIDHPFVDLRELDIQILSNIAQQIFNTGAVARTAASKVYYKRLLFSQLELGAQLAVRR